MKYVGTPKEETTSTLRKKGLLLTLKYSERLRYALCTWRDRGGSVASDSLMTSVTSDKGASPGICQPAAPPPGRNSDAFVWTHPKNILKGLVPSTRTIWGAHFLSKSRYRAEIAQSLLLEAGFVKIPEDTHIQNTHICLKPTTGRAHEFDYTIYPHGRANIEW
jgi:hypothetical protein